MSEMVLINGDCYEELKFLESSSIDSMVTDPPAGISFMGKEWDAAKGGRDAWIEWLQEIMHECLRVLKPGGHALVWALPRTSHWTAFACEKAGFEIRDCITHVFGSGFPKSLDVSKAIDKMAGAEREVVGDHPYASRKPNGSSGIAAVGLGDKPILTAPATDEAKQWQGWGTALKPASEHWWLLRKPLGEKTVAKNVLKWSTGGINIDSSRIGGSNDQTRSLEVGAGSPQEEQYDNSCMSCLLERASSMEQQTACEQKRDCDLQPGVPLGVEVGESQSPLERGTLCESGRLYICPHGKRLHAGAQACDGKTSGPKADERRGGSSLERGEGRQSDRKPQDLPGSGQAHSGESRQQVSKDRTLPTSLGRFPANLIVDESAVAELDRQSGVSKSTGGGLKNADKFGGGYSPPGQTTIGLGDTGGASRFFYCPKASRKDRGTDNKHPTVKSTKLMEYLITMVTPPHGTVLDPFMGSGSTGVAARRLGFDFVGIEKDAEYFEIAKKRIEGIK